MMSLEEEIKAHTERVEAGDPVRYSQGCPRCAAQGTARVHDCRPRTFRLVIEGVVRVVLSGLWRWNCTACGKRFTDYPRLPCRTSDS
jgi:transposase